MSIIVRMPEILTGMSEAVLIQWHVAPGDEVAIGQPLAEVETEKATVEYEAEQAGTLAQYLVELGQPVAVGTPIAVLVGPGESLGDAPGSAAPSTSTHESRVDDAAADADKPADADNPADHRPPTPQRQFVSPIVRKIARENNIDITGLRGSGPHGRVIRRDIERLVSAQAPPPPNGAEPLRPVPTPVTAAPVATAVPMAATAVARAADQSAYASIPHTGMRRAIARRLTESKATVPHFYLVADCDADALLALRRTVNEQSGAGISVNDFVIKAVAGALQDVPEANAIWTPDATHRFSSADIAVAVAIDGGLVTPVVRNVEQRSLRDVSRTIRDLVGRGREGRLKQHELEGGAFTVSNLGMYGIERFSAIINPPHAGILAVGAATERPVVRDGRLTVGKVMTVTLSGDHRVLDGALAAQWLSAFAARIENPMTILI